MLLHEQRNVRINSDENDAVLARESRSALKLTVGFSNICYKLQHIFNLDIKLTVSHFSFLITINNTFVFEDSNGSISVSILN
jgi:hypothetical protein